MILSDTLFISSVPFMYSSSKITPTQFQQLESTSSAPGLSSLPPGILYRQYIYLHSLLHISGDHPINDRKTIQEISVY